jgi:pyruvate dehydrogenase E2 component (dihydrolipoamide acetyltransferase)
VRERIPLVGMRRSIAERLRGSLSTTASVTLTREVDAEVFADARDRLKARFAGGLPFDALFVKLVAAALSEHPELNAVVEGDAILLLGEIHVGVAVAVAGGLLVPVVRNADRRSLGEVAAEVLALSARAKAGQLRAEDMAGGTFTITNLGGHGIDAFSPIINPPQAGILGIGRILPRAVVRDGQLVARRTCVLSLTFDHRVADGVPAARLLDAIAGAMADDARLNAL